MNHVQKCSRLIPIVFLALSFSLQGQTYDLIIRNGKIIDGTGNPWFYADVAIEQDKIVAIGNLKSANATEEIDASGLTLCPGFIDIHSHADGPFGQRVGIRAEHPKLKAAHNMVFQGVTTLVVNQDGRSPRSVKAQRIQLEEQGFGPNVILMIGHNSIRGFAMGNDYRRLATPEELVKMKGSIREALEAGAFGMTAGLEYVPGRWSNTEEIIDLVSILKEYGGVYIVHERASGSDPMWYVPSQHADEKITTMLENIQEVIQVAEVTGVPSCATHIKIKGADYWGSSNALIYQIQEARNRGVDVWADQYPYNTTGSDGNTVLIPDWALNRNRWTGRNASESPKEKEDSFAERLDKTLANDQLKRDFYQDVQRAIQRRGGPEQIIVFEFPDENLLGKSLLEVAKMKNCSVIEAVIFLQKNGFQDRPGGARLRGFSLNEFDIETLAAQPWVITASDAGVALPEEGSVHARFYGTFPRKIAHYAIKRKVLSVEDAIRSATSLPAQFLGLQTRGLLKMGYKADIAILDLNQIQDKATFENPHQYPDGIEYVLINGKWIIKNAQLTDQLPGEIIDIKESSRYPQK